MGGDVVINTLKTARNFPQQSIFIGTFVILIVGGFFGGGVIGNNLKAKSFNATINKIVSGMFIFIGLTLGIFGAIASLAFYEDIGYTGTLIGLVSGVLIGISQKLGGEGFLT